MRTGFGTPNLKKPFKARTTSKYKGQLKSATDSTYGKKGTGWSKNPKKVLYNRIYNKTTKSIFDIFK